MLLTSKFLSYNIFNKRIKSPNLGKSMFVIKENNEKSHTLLTSKYSSLC